MFEVDGIVYADGYCQGDAELEVTDVKPLSDYIMLVTFSTGETRLFDVSQLFDKQVFAVLLDETIFAHPKIESGICTWAEGAVDVSTMYLFNNSYPYA